MTETNHDYDRIIKDTLEKWGQSTVNALWEKTGIPHGTFFSHWSILKRKGQVEPVTPLSEQKPKKGQRQFYRLSESTKSKRRWGFKEKIISQRESRNQSQDDKETDKQKLMRVILFLFLSETAKGSGRNMPRIGKAQPGDYEVSNPQNPTGQDVCFYKEVKGVTVNDLTEHRDVGNARAFAHINLTESEVEDCIKTIRENELSDAVLYTSRKGNYIEPTFVIKDDLLQKFVKHCLALMSEIMQMIEYRWLYMTRRRPTHGPEFEWYVSFFGEKRIDYLFSKGKANLDQFIRDVKKISSNSNTRNKKMYDIKKEMGKHYILSTGEAIIHQYHTRILCRKHDITPPEGDVEYAAYCKFVRNAPQKYRALLDMVVEMVYPHQLQRLHIRYTELVKYRKKLIDKPM
jgi:hypothetical protein